MKDGLSDGARSLLQDSRGFIWVGTMNGLNKFDGYQFKRYLPDPVDSSGLIHRIVISLWEDHHNRIWIGTTNGLVLLDLKTEKFTHLALDPTNKSKTRVQHISENSNNAVWICTNDGIFLVDPELLATTKLFELPTDTYGNELEANDIAETKDGVVWVSTDQGIIKWDGPGKKPTRYVYHQKDPLTPIHRTIYIDRLDRIWVGGLQSVDLFDPGTETFTHFIPELTDPNPRIDVKDILETTDGKLLIGSSVGVYLFDPDTGRFELIIEVPGYDLLQDRQHNLWVGAYYGIYQIPALDTKFKLFQVPGITEVGARVHAKDNDGNVWMVTHNPNRLFRFDPFSSAFTSYSHNPKNPRSYSGDAVYDIIPSDDGGVWIASFHSLEKFNPEEEAFEKIALPLDPKILMMDSENELWIGGYSQIGRYDLDQQTFEPIRGYADDTRCILEDRYKNVWIGTGQAVYRYNLTTRELKLFNQEPLNHLSLSDNFIFDIMLDVQGTIWLGTLGGLNQIVAGTESSQPEFIHWNTSNSNLPFDNVNSVVDGKDGTVWLSSGNQVSHFYPQEGTFRNYDYRDGLGGSTIGSGLMGPKGEIYMGGPDGIVAFHPDSLLDNEHKPPVVITGFSINNQDVVVKGSARDTISGKSPLTETIQFTKSIKLGYHQRNFALEFTALNYINPENNRYRYKLEPYEQDWIETSASNRIARYTNMSPGKYIFMVIGSNNDGIWNEMGQSLEIIIKPPLWATWWAYGLYGLCALGLVLALRHYEKKRFILRQKARSLEEIDKAKTEFFTNISHELRTPLTLIMGPLKAIQQGTYQGDKEPLFTMMSQNGRRLLQLVNQLMDLSKLDQGKLKIELQDCNIKELVRQVVANFDSVCAMKNIELEFLDNYEPIFSQVDVEKIRQVLYNLLSNAVKFTPNGGQIKVSANRIETGGQDMLNIIVRDSGIGIPREELGKVFDRFYQVKNVNHDESEGTGIGLALTQKLVQLHGGTIEVESELGRGSTFTVMLPIVEVEAEPKSLIETETKPDITPVVEPDTNGTPHSNTQTQTHTHKSTLLLVEDNAQMRQYLRYCLGGEYHYLEAANGLEGLQLAKDKMPDLILCDVMMPGLDGFELCKMIRDIELTAHIPFIFLTAKADPDSRLQGLKIGSSDYLIKPFEATELRLKVNNHLQRMQRYRSFFTKQLAIRGDIDQVPSLDKVFLEKAIKAVESQLDNHEFSVETFARQTGMSQAQLYRKLLALTGQSPSAFIRSIRLKKAAQLILQNYGNTSQVAYSVGFSTLSYFAKCFKKQFGVLPSVYGRK